MNIKMKRGDLLTIDAGPVSVQIHFSPNIFQADVEVWRSGKGEGDDKQFAAIYGHGGAIQVLAAPPVDKEEAPDADRN